jgi:hypothetical protein
MSHKDKTKQPSGMVLLDHERAKLVNALRDCAKAYAGTDQLRAQIATVLGQFMPLNSSPVSAGCDTCHGQGEIYSGDTAYQGQFQPPEPIMITCPECSGESAQPVSTGGVDERAAFDALESDCREMFHWVRGCGAYENGVKEIVRRSKARAAPSAVSQEQGE